MENDGIFCAAGTNSGCLFVRMQFSDSNRKDKVTLYVGLHFVQPQPTTSFIGFAVVTIGFAVVTIREIHV